MSIIRKLRSIMSTNGELCATDPFAFSEIRFAVTTKNKDGLQLMCPCIDEPFAVILRKHRGMSMQQIEQSIGVNDADGVSQKLRLIKRELNDLYEFEIGSTPVAHQIWTCQSAERVNAYTTLDKGASACDLLSLINNYEGRQERLRSAAKEQVVTHGTFEGKLFYWEYLRFFIEMVDTAISIKYFNSDKKPIPASEFIAICSSWAPG